MSELKKLLSEIKFVKKLAVYVVKLENLLKDSPILYPYITLPNKQEDYFASLSYATRRYFRRYMKKYLEIGGDFAILPPDNITKQDIDAYIGLHLLRWGDGSAAICGKSVEYHRKISQAMMEQDLLILFFAVFEGERIAYIHVLILVHAEKDI